MPLLSYFAGVCKKQTQILRVLKYFNKKINKACLKLSKNESQNLQIVVKIAECFDFFFQNVDNFKKYWVKIFKS